jgi:hypothetical protein
MDDIHDQSLANIQLVAIQFAGEELNSPGVR